MWISHVTLGLMISRHKKHNKETTWTIIRQSLEWSRREIKKAYGIEFEGLISIIYSLIVSVVYPNSSRKKTITLWTADTDSCGGENRNHYILRKLSTLDLLVSFFMNEAFHNKWEFDRAGGVWKVSYRDAAKEIDLSTIDKIIKGISAKKAPVIYQ